MQKRISNEIKVLLYIGNIDELSGVLHKNECNTIMQYSYEAIRNRDNMGFPRGDSSSLILELTIRNFSHVLSRHFLKELRSNRPYDYTFLFNAIFDDNKILSKYDNRLTAKGYIIELEEAFGKQQEGDLMSGQKIMKAKLLISKLIYHGENNNSVLSVSND